MKKLKLLTGATAPLVCAIAIMALSQQSGAKEADVKRSDKPVSQQQTGKPILSAEQQKLADQMTQDILNQVFVFRGVSSVYLVVGCHNCPGL